MATPPGTGPKGPTSPADPTKVQNQEEYAELLLKSAKRQERLNQLERERADLLQMSSEALQKQLDTQNSILNALLGEIPDLDQIKILQDDILRIQKEKNAEVIKHSEQFRLMSESVAEQMKLEADAVEVIEETMRRINEQKDAEIALNKQKIEQIKKEHKFMIETLTGHKDLKGFQDLTLKNGRKFLEVLEDTESSEKEIRDAILEANAINTDMIKLQGKLSSHAGKFADKLGMARDASGTSLGAFIGITKQMSQMNQAGFSMGEALSAAFGQSFNMLNIFASILDIIKDMVIQLDGVGKKLGGSTGMGNVFQSQIMNVYSATVSGGGSMEEASSAIGSLANSFSAFNPKAKATNEYLATTIVRLGKIGVGGDQAAKTMDFFTRSLKMTEKQAADLTVELALMGQQMGMTSTQIINDFQSVSSDLSVYGKNAINVFKDLEAQAKATGVQISALVGLAKQFDTFDSAADKAAQLNAVLGTQLSSLELMNMSYDERVNYIRQEVSFAAGNMENMDQYTQQFIAQALGVSSVAEAQKLLNMSQGEYLKYQNDMASANKRQEDLAALTQQLVPVMEQLKIAFMQVATSLAPIISLVAGIIGIFGPYLDLIVIAIGAFKLFNVLLPAFNLLKGIGLALQYQEIGTTQALTVMRLKDLGIQRAQTAANLVYNTSATIAAAGTKAWAFAQQLLNWKMGLFVGVMLLLYAVFKKKINPVFVAVFHFMAAGVTILGRAFSTIQGPAMLAILVFSLMFAAMALFVYSLKELISTLVQSGDGLFTAATGMYAIAGGITAIAGAMLLLGPFGVLGLIGLSLSMTKLGEGFEKTASGIERISKMGNALSGLGSNGLIAISSEGNKINAIMGTGDVMNNFSAGKMQVEVKMPEMETPKIELRVELMGKELEAFVKDVIARSG